MLCCSQFYPIEYIQNMLQLDLSRVFDINLEYIRLSFLYFNFIDPRTHKMNSTMYRLMLLGKIMKGQLSLYFSCSPIHRNSIAHKKSVAFSCYKSKGIFCYFLPYFYCKLHRKTNLLLCYVHANQ